MEKVERPILCGTKMKQVKVKISASLPKPWIVRIWFNVLKVMGISCRLVAGLIVYSWLTCPAQRNRSSSCYLVP